MSVQSIDRAFDILELLANNQEGITLSDLGRELCLHKSTVHRLLASLKERGYIEQTGKSGLYRLGLGFILLSSSYLNGIELKTESEPYLKELSRLLNQTVFLAILQENQVVYIDKYEQANSLRRYSIIGRRAPLYCTSLGKSLLLDKSDEDIIRLTADVPFNKRTVNTIPDIETLVIEIASSRGRGWTIDDQENEYGVQCMAVPIFDYRGQIIAAISTAWNMEYQHRDFEEMARPVKEAAGIISGRLGWISESL